MKEKITNTRAGISFCRRLYIAYLIDEGVNTAPALEKRTKMANRTIQNAISRLDDLQIACKFKGATKTGNYVIEKWGPIDKNWIKKQLKHIKEVL